MPKNDASVSALAAYNRAMSTAVRSTPRAPGAGVLLTCLVPDLEALQEALPAALAAKVDVPLLALQHGLVPLVHHRLRETGLWRLLPESQWEQLSALRLEAIERRVRRLDAGSMLLEALTKAGLSRFLPLKGWAMMALPGGDQLRREMIDLDLLVDPEELEQVVEVLGQVGFQPADIPWRPTPYEYHLPRFERKSVPLELHWALWPYSPLQPFGLPDFAGLYERALTGHLDGRDVMVPCVEDQVLIVAASLAEDGFAAELRQWGDVYWLLERLEPGTEQRLWERAREFRMYGFLLLVLCFLQELLQHDLPLVFSLPPALEQPYRRLALIARRRLWVPQARRSSFWMLVGLRRLAHRSPPHLATWLSKLPPSLRASATDRAALGALAQCGGAAIAGGRMLRRLGTLAVLPQERRALREDLRLVHLLHKLAQSDRPH